MFILSRIEDIVRVPPCAFREQPETAIINCLNSKYSNKVLHEVGLCIKVFDILSTTDFIVHQCQDGSYQTKVEFRLVVFRPFTGEIITGRIKNCNDKMGIQVKTQDLI